MTLAQELRLREHTVIVPFLADASVAINDWCWKQIHQRAA